MIDVEFDDNGCWQGLLVKYADVDRTKIEYKGYYLNDVRHGEFIRWDKHGALLYHMYYVNGLTFHNFVSDPVSDEERMLLVLKYGAPLFCKGGI